MTTDILEQLVSAVESGKPVCLVTVVKAEGSTPRDAGAKMLVFSDGGSVGTIGGSLVEKTMIDKAVEAIKTGKPQLETFRLTESESGEASMICGGEMTIFLEPIRAGKTLLIFGAGHCGHALARTASAAGFVIHVFDDRPDVASRERFPMAASITVGEYDETSAAAEFPADSYIAIMTQGHAADTVVLKNLIKKKYRYIGMMASTRKRDEVFNRLSEIGIAKSLLDKVYSPIGLDINAETPEEIAVSIVAELITIPHEEQIKKTE